MSYPQYNGHSLGPEAPPFKYVVATVAEFADGPCRGLKANADVTVTAVDVGGNTTTQFIPAGMQQAGFFTEITGVTSGNIGDLLLCY